MNRSLHIATPLGRITLTASERAIVGLSFGSEIPAGAELVAGEAELRADGEVTYTTGAEIPLLLRRAAEELGEYLAGRRRDFSVPLDPRGSDFQRQVWQALRSIPYGQTRTYGQIAEQIGRRRAARAVGMANNRNPIAILIPCHRVIGSDGSMTGYAAGIAIKERLLALERRNTLRAEGELFPVRDER